MPPKYPDLSAADQDHCLTIKCAFDRLQQTLNEVEVDLKNKAETMRTLSPFFEGWQMRTVYSILFGKDKKDLKRSLSMFEWTPPEVNGI